MNSPKLTREQQKGFFSTSISLYKTFDSYTENFSIKLLICILIKHEYMLKMLQ